MNILAHLKILPKMNAGGQHSIPQLYGTMLTDLSLVRENNSAQEPNRHLEKGF